MDDMILLLLRSHKRLTLRFLDFAADVSADFLTCSVFAFDNWCFNDMFLTGDYYSASSFTSTVTAVLPLLTVDFAAYTEFKLAYSCNA